MSRPDRSNASSGDRQHHGRSVYQSARGHTLVPGVPVGEGDLGLGVCSSAVPGCSACAGCQQHDRRLPLPSSTGGQQRLEAGQRPVSLDCDARGSTSLRFVRIETQQPTSPVCQLVSGPGRSSSGCAFAAQPHVGGRLSLSPDSISQPLSPVHPVPPNCQCRTNSTSMEGSGLLSSAVVHVTEPPVAAAGDTGSRVGSIRRITSDGGQPAATSRLATIREAARSRGRLAHASRLWVSLWRSSTQSSYESAWNIWIRWCQRESLDPLEADEVRVANFLASQFESGKQYRTLNVYRSALSSTLPVRADELPIGQSPTVRRVMAGVYNERPPQPRYSETWCVASVLQHLACLDNQSVSLGQLSQKLVMLIALARASRVSTLHALSIQSMPRKPDGVQFILTRPTKTQRVGSAPKEFVLPRFAQASTLCPVVCLDEYLSRTISLRSAADTGLFVSTRPPHQVVSSATLARWLKTVLKAAGISSTFTAHSTRGASTTAATVAGVTMAEVLAAADWSGQHTFIEHYYRPSSQLFTDAVLSSGNEITSHHDSRQS